MAKARYVQVLAAALGIIGTRLALAEDLPRPVAFQTSDHLLISAEYYPAPEGSATRGKAPVAVLLHALDSQRNEWRTLVPELRGAGFAVVALDWRGHGASSSPELRIRVKDRDPLLAADLDRDLLAAYDWIAQQEELDRARWVLIGNEIGALAALRYATRDRSVDAIVCLNPALELMGLSARNDLAKIKGRAILLAGPTAADDSACSTLARQEPAAKVVALRPSDQPTDALADNPSAVREVTEFCRRALKPKPGPIVYGSINSTVYHRAGSLWIPEIAPSNLRYYSSPAEAEARGLRKARSQGPKPGESRKDGDDEHGDDPATKRRP